MNKEEQALTKQLIKQISKLPRWSFGWLQTINGSIFQGRYIKKIQDGSSRIIFIKQIKVLKEYHFINFCEKTTK